MRLPLGFVEYLTQAKKTIVKEKPSIHLVSSRKGSYKKKKPSKIDKKDEGTIYKVLKPNGGVKKGKENEKGTCHHCRKLEHWRHNCKEYIESVKWKKMKGASTLGTKSYDDLFFPIIWYMIPYSL